MCAEKCEYLDHYMMTQKKKAQLYLEILGTMGSEATCYEPMERLQ